VDLLYLVQMLHQPVVAAVGQHGHPIACALAIAHRHLVGGKIDVFDP
jgi:hypothetical protein